MVVREKFFNKDGVISFNVLKMCFVMICQAQKKGKEGTKGSKQIVEENRTTLVFYRNMLGGALLAQVIVTFGLFSEVTGWDYVSCFEICNY